MKNHRCCLLLLLASTACPSSAPPAKAPERATLRLELPASLEPRRQRYRREYAAALDQVLKWFARQGFPRKRAGIVDQVVVFGDVAQMKSRLARRFSMSPDKIPATFGGTVDKKTLLVVREEMFKKNYARLYPTLKWDSGTYRRLMAHELAHRVHAMIATELFGTEDGMGPRWLFEGLAIACTGQFPGLEEPHLTWEQLAKRMERDKKGIQTYPIYKRMFRSLQGSFSVKQLVQWAGRDDLIHLLKKHYMPPSVVLERPRGTPRGRVLLIHGSAPFNVDGRIPVPGLESPYAKSDFYKDLSAALVARGFSVLRYAKPGVDPHSLDREEYAGTDYARLALQLQNLWRNFMPRTRPRLVFAWSEGSLHVRALPLSEVDGVVLLGGISTNIGAVVQAQGGPPPAALKAALSKKKRTEMLGLDRPVGRMLDELAMADNHATFAPFPRLPLLVLHGAADREVPVDQARVWKKALPKHPVTVVEGVGRDHRFMLPGKYDVTELAGQIGRWVEQALPKQP